MKITGKFGTFAVEVEADNVKDAFADLAGVAEVLCNNVCGACDSKEVRPAIRVFDGNTYYAMQCRSCGAELGFGQTKATGSLFPKRKAKDGGGMLENGGWTIFRRQEIDAANF